MIETRYSIEYIDPNPKKILSKLGKLLTYIVLTISIIVAISALILSNLSQTTSQNLTIKVQDFVNSFNTATTPSIISSEAIDEQLTQQKSDSSEREMALKKEIELLNQENTIQHNKSIQQLKTNQTLNEKIALLSKQLKDEKLKHSQLAKEVASLNRKNKSVSAQLDEKIQAAKDYAIEIKKLEHKKTTIVKPNITATPILLEKESPSKEKETKISQIDAIVAAMEAANKTSSAINIETTKPKDND